MPKLIRLYIVNTAIGFALSVAFVAALVGFDVGGLGRLILGSDIGAVALVMLVVFNGIVFAGVQFGFAIMRMAVDSDDDRGHGPNLRLEPIALRVPAQEISRQSKMGRFPNARR